MADDVLVILDICLQRIRSGETLQQCLADFPEYRSELEALLQTVLTLQALKQVSPSEEFCRTSEARLMTKIRSESVRKSQEREKVFDLSKFGRSLIFRTLVPVTLVVLIALIVWAALPLISPAPVSANAFTLSLLSGTAEVKPAGSATWVTGSDSMTLEAGSSVRTAFDSAALLTFFDGSSTKLEPGAEVKVSRSEYNGRGSLYYIALEQQSGRTWCYVLAGGEEKPYFSVRTPQGEAVAQGTAFSAAVEEGGQTRFVVMEGAIRIVEGENEIHLAAGQQIQVGNGMALSIPQPVPPARQEIVVTTGPQGIGSVKDPSGASTGSFPDGMAFNQITGSKSLFSSNGQQILVEEPAEGEYLLAVRSLSGEAIPVDIQAKQEGQVVFQYKEILPVNAGEGWLIRIKLDLSNRAKLSGKLVSLESLAGKTPEKVVKPDLVMERTVPVTPASSQTTTRPAPETTFKPAAATPVPSTTRAESTGIPITGNTATGAAETSGAVATSAQAIPETTKTSATSSLSITASSTTTPVSTVKPVNTTSAVTGNATTTTVTPVTETTKPAVTTSTDTGNIAATTVAATTVPVKTTPVNTGVTSGTAATSVTVTTETASTSSTGTGSSSGTAATNTTGTSNASSSGASGTTGTSVNTPAAGTGSTGTAGASTDSGKTGTSSGTNSSSGTSSVVK